MKQSLAPIMRSSSVLRALCAVILSVGISLLGMHPVAAQTTTTTSTTPANTTTTNGTPSNTANVTATAAQIQAAQQQGAQIGYAMQSAPVIDANGNVVQNANGSVATTSNSSATAQSSAAMVQGLLGINGFQSAGSSGSSVTFGGVATTTSGVNISCNSPSGTVVSAAGVLFMFSKCDIKNNTITAIEGQICTAINTGGLCDATGDYSAMLSLTAGAYSTVNGSSVGVGCNNSIRTCQLTITAANDSTVTGTGLTAKAAAQQPNELQGAIATTVNSGTYQGEMTSQQSIVDCYTANQTSFAANGSVSTCDKATTASVAGGPAGTACTPTTTCTKQVTTTQAYTSTCTREFPVTNYTCPSTTPTKTCTDDLNSATGAISNASCADSDIAGATLVGTVAASCTSFVSAPDGSQTCTDTPETKYYVFTAQATVAGSGQCTASPNPINGNFGPAVCDTTAQDTQNNCATGGWFGRTLSDQECQGNTTTASGTAIFTQFGYQQKAGCGYCINDSVSYLCQGKPTATNGSDTCATTNLSGCTLTGVTAQSTQGGVTLSQLETYNCSSTVTSCAQTQTSNTCASADASYGVAAMPVTTDSSTGAFSQAIAASTVVDAVAQSVQGSAATPGTPLSLFPGVNERCREPLGFVSGLLSTNCCKTSLTKTGGALIDGCNDQEVSLAAARRSKYTYYLGEYCSSRIKFLFFSTCVQNTQVYCAFQGMLPRIIQVQGRQQLAALAASTQGAVMQNHEFDFSYYSGNGGWQPPVSVNGVQTAFFQQPSYCTDPTTAAATLSANANAAPCSPNLDVWFATCENTAGCGALPDDPTGGSATGTWVLTPVDPLSVTSTTISEHAIAQGACNTSTQKCSYQVSAWPAGSAGAIFLSQQVNFGIYNAPVISGSASLAIIGNTAFRPVGVHAPTATAATAAPVNTITGTLPSTIPAQVSLDGGTTWSTFNLPTRISSQFYLPGSQIEVTGGCTALAAMCDYTLTGSVEVAAKPWGSVSNPDCSGFTMTQFSEINISKMDLSEWTASISQQVSANTSTFAAQAQAQAATNASASNTQLQGQNSTTGGITPLTAVVNPLQALGPFTATVTIAGNWPAAGITPDDPISNVEIDWGDCSAPGGAQESPAGGFTATHLYQAPNTPGMCDSAGAASSSNPRNLNEIIKLKINSKSGQHTYNLTVVDAWQDYQNLNGPGSATVTGPPN